jgi:hypothetical protein
MCVLGMSEELKPDRIAVNALWPKTTIWTAAMEMLSGGIYFKLIYIKQVLQEMILPARESPKLLRTLLMLCFHVIRVITPAILRSTRKFFSKKA